MAAAARRPVRRAADWAAVGLWVTLIFSLSGDGYSNENTSSFLEPFIRWLLPGLTGEAFDTVHFWVRKSLHAVEYGALGLLADNALRGGPSPSDRTVIVAVIALVTVVALCDEGRQHFSPVRTGSLLDVALDITGGFLAVGFLAALRRIRGAPEAPRG